MNDSDDFPETPNAQPDDQSGSRDLTSIADFSKRSLATPQPRADDTEASSSPAESEVLDGDFEPIENSVLKDPVSTGSDAKIDNSAILVAPPELEPESKSDLISPQATGKAIPGSTPSVIDQIREFSEQLPNRKSSVPAAIPFSLTITGDLTADEQDKLCDILSREKMGISKVDLEPQFEGGRILIPRISEYAGVLLVQSLRDTRATLRLAPSDEVYSTEATITTPDEKIPASGIDKQKISIRAGSGHPAETLPITTGAVLPEIRDYAVVDVLTASVALKTTLVEAEASVEYQEALEALQRELRYKAYYRQAIGILNFSAQLSTLQLPSEYRLTVTGTAIRKS